LGGGLGLGGVVIGLRREGRLGKVKSTHRDSRVGGRLMFSVRLISGRYLGVVGSVGLVGWLQVVAMRA
jgi:hypothetical protein